MALGLVTKLDNKNTETLEISDDDAMLVNGDVIVFFPIYDQFAAIRKPNSGGMVYKTYILINNNLLSYKI